MIQITCFYIHQIFINRVAALKLVHFQGYDTRLIRIIVGNVPSIRISWLNLDVGIEYIPELLNSEPSHFSFSIHFAASLFKKFPLENT